MNEKRTTKFRDRSSIGWRPKY